MTKPETADSAQLKYRKETTNLDYTTITDQLLTVSEETTVIKAMLFTYI